MKITELIKDLNTNDMTQQEYTQKVKQINELARELYYQTHDLWEQAEIAEYSAKVKYKGSSYETFKDYVKPNIGSVCDSYRFLQAIEDATVRAGPGRLFL